MQLHLSLLQWMWNKMLAGRESNKNNQVYKWGKNRANREKKLMISDREEKIKNKNKMLVLFL